MGDELEQDHRLALDFVTPHTDWAQPYVGRRLRVFYFCSGRDTHAREMVELMQRFDLDADAAYWTVIVDTPTWQWHGGEQGVQRILRLLEEPYDVYLFNQIPLTNLPAEAQYKLLKPVTEGAGLVLLGNTDERTFKPENRLTELPAFLQGTGAEAYRVGQGRGVRLPAPPEIPYRFGWEVEYDHWQEKLGRAVLWAAGKEPEVELTLTVEPARIDRGRRGLLRVRSSALPPGARFSGRFRREEDGTVFVVPSSQWTSSGEHQIIMPLLPAGRYHAEVWMLGPSGVIAWATAPFAVASPHGIEAIQPQRAWAEEGEAFGGRIRLRQPREPDEWVEIRLKDRRGRILARQRRKPAGRFTSYHFPAPPWSPMLLQLEAVLYDGLGEVAGESVYLHVTQRRRGRFNFLVWDYPRGPTAPYAEEALARLGMTLQLAGGTPPSFVGAFDVAWVPYTTRILAPLNEQGHMQPVCWNDEQAAQAYVEGIVNQYREARQHGVFAYSLGDETVTRGACLHPACLRAYRQYLVEQYKGSIEKLNTSWGTHYADFDAIEVRDNDEATALREGAFARWFDRQAFQCANFVRFCRRFRDAYAWLDPQARTGFEGAGQFDQGDDYDLIVRTNGFWSPYPGPGDEVLRSLAPRDFPRANWMGYQKDADSLLRWYWRMVTRGSDAIWWWRWDNIGRFNGLLQPDLNPFPAVAEMMRDTQIMRDGLGDLLLHSEMEHDGIALLYSFPSAYAVRVENGPSFGGYQDHHVAWHRALRDLGLQFHYVTDRMLRQGEWAMERDRVLILARAEALSEEEADVIRRFVRQGGTVIADLRPGIFDGHCKPRERGVLDDLFGIERRGRGPAGTSPAVILGLPPGEEIVLRLEHLAVDPEVSPPDAGLGRSGRTPIVIGRKVGQGQAVLLNFGLPSYPPLHRETSPEATAIFLESLLREAGIEARYRLRTPAGERLRNIELVRWRTGEIELLALFREAGEPGEAHVLLPEKRAVYDLRQRRFVGETAELRSYLRPGRAQFFALLPGVASKVTISAPPTAKRGEAITVRIQAPDAVGLHAVRLRVTLPNGREGDWFRPIVLAGKEGAETSLPIAYNDPTGAWWIEGVELYSGRVFGKAVQVE